MVYICVCVFWCMCVQCGGVCGTCVCVLVCLYSMCTCVCAVYACTVCVPCVDVLYEFGSQRRVLGVLYDALPYTLEQWFTPFLRLRPFDSLPHAVLTPTLTLFLLLFHKCTLATAMNRNADTCVF